MDREEMRFIVALDVLRAKLKMAPEKFQGVDIHKFTNEFMEAFDKSRPDYQDPARLEETIQARVDGAVLAERQRAFACLLKGEFDVKGTGVGLVQISECEIFRVLFEGIPESERREMFNG